MNKLLPRLATLAGALILVTAAATTTANAESSAAAGGHCTLGLAPTGTTAPGAGTVRCFATLSDAVAFATGGAIRLPADAEVVTDAQASSAVGVATNPLLGIEYKDSSYRGSTWTLYGTSGSGCYGGVSYGFYHISRFGWGDTISSAKAYSGCTGVHYEDGDASGSTYNCTCSSMGVMNDETSAIIFR